MKKFSEIEQFRHVVRTVQNYHERIGQAGREPTLHFVGTVKLHGTNAGIRRHKGEFRPQSRSQAISVDSDNYQFAQFVESIDKDQLNEMFNRIGGFDDDITIYGEWIGKGIQSNVAISELDRQWVVFGAWKNGEYVCNDKSWELPGQNIFNIFRAGWFRLAINFKDPAASLEELEKITLRVEQECPYAKLWNVSGVGEGVVWFCEERPTDSDLWFKTKGEKHSSKKKSGKKIATIDPQKVESINQCVDIVLTEGRLNQGLEQFRSKGIEIEPKNIGPYLKWINEDVRKEEMDTIEANNLEWKDVQKVITNRARQHFLDEANKF